MVKDNAIIIIRLYDLELNSLLYSYMDSMFITTVNRSGFRRTKNTLIR